MEVTLHAITANRTLPKAKVRNRAVVDVLEAHFTRVILSHVEFDTLQILLVDHPKGAVTFPMKRPKDRIYQIAVGVGTQNFLALSREQFLAEMVAACRAALQNAPFGVSLKTSLLDCLTRAEG